MVESIRRDAVLEIGTEEIPARFMVQALRDLEAAGRALVDSNRLEAECVKSYGTPRRLVLYIKSLTPIQSDLIKDVRGPAVRAGYDESGNPTKAVLGFAKSAGIDVSRLERRMTEQGEYVFARVVEPGQPAAIVLARAFARAITDLAFPKNMRWGDNDLRFVRPIRWILALYGDEIVQFSVGDIASSRETYGHRTIAPGPHQVGSAEDYMSILEKSGVLVDQEVRSRAIVDQAQLVAATLGGRVDIDPELLEEITYIVEWPTAFAGEFDRGYLDLPEPCIITPMKEHQRYFPVRDARGSLMPAFIGVRNGTSNHIATVRAGNEKVLAARLADARFFFEEDVKTPLETLLPKLKTVMFQEKLGTVHDKVVRLSSLARYVLSASSSVDLSVVDRACALCKCDLLTAMVKEFTELQGIMGREYALRQGESREVADALFQHYLPRSAGDDLPGSLIGAGISIADKLDTLTGYFGIGLIPSGSQDPYALRRQATGVLMIHAKFGLAVSLQEIARKALDLHWPHEPKGRSKREILFQVGEFLSARLRGLLEEKGTRYDVADAVLSAGPWQPATVFARAEALEAVVDEEWMAGLVTALTRVRNIATHSSGDSFTADLFEVDAERVLALGLVSAKRQVEAVLGGADLSTAGPWIHALRTYAGLRPAIDQFFEAVMIMAKDEAVRANRLGLLKAIENSILDIADFSKIVSQ